MQNPPPPPPPPAPVFVLPGFAHGESDSSSSSDDDDPKPTHAAAVPEPLLFEECLPPAAGSPSSTPSPSAPVDLQDPDVAAAAAPHTGAASSSSALPPALPSMSPPQPAGGATPLEGNPAMSSPPPPPIPPPAAVESTAPPPTSLITRLLKVVEAQVHPTVPEASANYLRQAAEWLHQQESKPHQTVEETYEKLIAQMKRLMVWQVRRLENWPIEANPQSRALKGCTAEELGMILTSITMLRKSCDGAGLNSASPTAAPDQWQVDFAHAIQTDIPKSKMDPGLWAVVGMLAARVACNVPYLETGSFPSNPQPRVPAAGQQQQQQQQSRLLSNPKLQPAPLTLSVPSRGPRPAGYDQQPARQQPAHQHQQPAVPYGPRDVPYPRGAPPLQSGDAGGRPDFVAPPPQEPFRRPQPPVGGRADVDGTPQVLAVENPEAFCQRHFDFDATETQMLMRVAGENWQAMLIDLYRAKTGLRTPEPIAAALGIALHIVKAYLSRNRSPFTPTQSKEPFATDVLPHLTPEWNEARRALAVVEARVDRQDLYCFVITDLFGAPVWVAEPFDRTTMSMRDGWQRLLTERNFRGTQHVIPHNADRVIVPPEIMGMDKTMSGAPGCPPEVRRAHDEIFAQLRSHAVRTERRFSHYNGLRGGSLGFSDLLTSLRTLAFTIGALISHRLELTGFRGNVAELARVAGVRATAGNPISVLSREAAPPQTYSANGGGRNPRGDERVGHHGTGAPGGHDYHHGQQQHQLQQPQQQQPQQPAYSPGSGFGAARRR